MKIQSSFLFTKVANMQAENKKKVKTSIEEQIKIKEEKLQQDRNQIKILKRKLSEENRKKRNKRVIEKGAIFESIFEQTTIFTTNGRKKYKN